MYRIRPASLCFVAALAIAPLPAHAQGPPGGGGPGANLNARVAALEAAVAKLEGNITEADLVGTYAVSAFLVGLTGGVPASIGAGVVVGTATLAAGGTSSLSSTLSGYSLTQGSPWLRGIISDSEVDNGSWTYANGVVTFVSPSETSSLNVAAGGRLLIGASANTDDPGLSVLIILTRLQ